MTIGTEWTRRTYLMSLLLVVSAASVALADPAYIRQPDLHDDTLVFCAESDLWVAGADGSNPRRLTTHVGNESAPAFSPDGEWIAFSAIYDGNEDVYVVPVPGGRPKRLTWHPGGDTVVGWTPDGDKVVFRSRRASPVGGTHLFTIDLLGGDAEELPLGWASRIDMDPATGQWAFVRNNRENRPWKRYRGGWTSDIWVGHPDRADFRSVTEFDGMDHFPMWRDGRIWFLSDRGGTSNLWSITPDGADRRQHTKYDDWDIRWPAAADDGRIVFTRAADVYIYDPATDLANKVDIDLGSELILTRTRYLGADRGIGEVAISPEGDRLAVIARGEMFSVPVEKGVTLPLGHTGGVRERSVVYDPQGEKVLYLTEKGVAEEIRARDAWGRGEPEIVKQAKKGVWHYQPAYSPDGKKIAYADNSYGLFVMDTDGGSPNQIDHGGTEGEIRHYQWSPDGRWLAYHKGLPNDFQSIFIYDTQEEKVHQVTGPYTSDWAPTWDPDGRYLYFLSDREINPLLDELDFNVVEMKNDRVYAVLLRGDVENPLRDLAGLPPAEEEDEKGEDAEAEDGEKKDEDAEEPKPVEIDFDGLPQRIVELPIPLGRYRGLSATSTHLFYVSVPARGMAESGDFFTPGPIANSLMQYSLEDKEAKEFLANIGGFQIAAKGAKMVILKEGAAYVVATAAPPGEALAEGKVDLSDVIVELEPHEEWSQIYHEAWRQMREFYWDEEMSGVNWDAIREQYATLVPRLASRADLTDLISQIFGEMNTSHTYVFGGDPGVQVPRRANGLLGAELVRTNDHAYEVKRIYRGDAPDRVVSPLDVPGVDVAEGDFILAVNGKEIASGRPFPAYLENLAGRSVILTVGDRPEAKETRAVAVVPTQREGELLYADWVRRNREYVLERTGGRMGYIHVPDMLNRGMIEFNTWFYPQLDKEGMVVDMRWNGGGSYSEIMLERLRRKVLSFSYVRGGAIGNYPDDVLNGPFVVLVNESSGSDGDIFPQAIQLEGLAPVIGSRTWGGVNGITSLRPLVDGGLVTQAQVAWWDPKDGWGLENRGVLPDIEVKSLPQDIARGIDSQLDRGIQELMRLHDENPPEKPDFGKSMRRSRDAYKREMNE